MRFRLGPEGPLLNALVERIYEWKARIGGMVVAEAKRLKPLDDENAELQRTRADVMLFNVAC